jgi:hypothetical protein
MVRSRPAHLGFQRVAGDGTVARCSQVVDGGEVLVASGEGENTDELREVSANPSMSSRCSFASSRRRKRRLETSRASARSSGLASSNPCEETVGKKGHQVRRSKVR